MGKTKSQPIDVGALPKLPRIHSWTIEEVRVVEELIRTLGANLHEFTEKYEQSGATRPVRVDKSNAPRNGLIAITGWLGNLNREFEVNRIGE